MAVLSSFPADPPRSSHHSKRPRDAGVSGIPWRRDRVAEDPVSRVIEERVYVALGKDGKESIGTLRWALQNSGGRQICILHVHRPDPLIPSSEFGMKLPANRVKEQQVDAYRKIERQKMHEILDYYLLICRRVGVEAEKLYTEMDNIEKGIVELIFQHGIKNLVMGAAADRHYSKKMVEIKSKKAIRVQSESPSSCSIWFICNEHLICTRQGSSDEVNSGARPVSVPMNPNVEMLLSRKLTQLASLDLDKSVKPHMQAQFDANLHNPSSLCAPDKCTEDAAKKVMMEGEISKQRRSKKSVIGGKAIKDVIEAANEGKQSESLDMEDVNLREMKQALAKGKEESEEIKKQRNEAMEALQVAVDQKSQLERQVLKSEQMIKELEEKIISAVDLLQNYKKELEDLQLERDKAHKEAERVRRKCARGTPCIPQFFTEFSLLKLEEATHNFDPSLKIGEGGYGSIYRTTLCHTEVAIKKNRAGSSQGPAEYQQEVDILSKLRHRNLITLIGACPEALALIYEYLPNGSLEDRLSCRDNTAPLPWQTRIRIAAELCCVLYFLHSMKPHGIVHCDVKPSNILLDGNFVSKLSDFGMCRVISGDGNLSNSTTEYCITHPKGTIYYADPEFFMTGELTPKSDVYSLGIILLQLLTGAPPLGISQYVQDALYKDNLSNVLDPSAGDWPFVQAKQLAHLALRCCEMRRKSRPDLSEVRRVIEPMVVSSGGASFPLHPGSKEFVQIPYPFICPIFREVMQDPHTAADGYTYEAEAIKGWLESDNDISPMTGHKLSHLNLIPNHALRSAILELLQHR